MNDFSGAAQWWVLVENQTYGPFDAAAMAQQVREQRIFASTMVTPVGSQEWIPAGSEPRLAPLFTAAKAPPRPAYAPASVPDVPTPAFGGPRPSAGVGAADGYEMSQGSLLFSFRGRINRQRFWLSLIGVSVVVLIVQAAIFLPYRDLIANSPMDGGQIDPALLPLFGGLALLTLVSLWPGLAIYAKRWHDRNKSGWWTLIMLVPLVGPIWFLVETGFLRGTLGPNRFGPDPLERR